MMEQGVSVIVLCFSFQ